MTSKKREVLRPQIWFPNRIEAETILIHYSARGKALEISALGNVGLLGGNTYRISLGDFLWGLGISAEDCAVALSRPHP